MRFILNKRYIIRAQPPHFRKIVDRKTWNESHVSTDLFDTLLLCNGKQHLSEQVIHDIKPFLIAGIVESSQDQPNCPDASYHVPTEILDRPIEMAFLCLTGRCNFKCKHCYFEPERNSNELTTSEWFKVVDILHEAGVYKICLTGGEALLRRDLPDICKKMENLGFLFRINSNGLLLNPLSVDRLRQAGLRRYQVSLDGNVSGIHDDFRGITSFDKIVRNLRYLSELRKAGDIDWLSVTTMLTKRTACNVKEMFRFLESELLIDIWYLERPLACGAYAQFSADYAISIQEAEPCLYELFALLERENPRKPGRVFLDKYYDWVNKDIYDQPEDFFSPYDLSDQACGSHFNHLYILPNGTTNICMHTDVFSDSGGNILLTGLRHVWHTLESTKNRFNLSDMVCAQCELVATCGGGCRVAAQLSTGSIDGCDTDCREHILAGKKRRLF